MRLVNILVGLTVAALLCAGCGARVETASPKEWLEERLNDAVAVTPGMTHADLMKYYEPAGGFEAGDLKTYVLRSCDLVRVDVQFETKPGVEFQAWTPNPEIRIADMSRPYLGR